MWENERPLQHSTWGGGLAERGDAVLIIDADLCEPGMFRYPVVDSLPVLPIADALILSALVDAVVFGLESGVAARQPVTRAYRILENVGEGSWVWSSTKWTFDIMAAMPKTVITIALLPGRPRLPNPCRSAPTLSVFEPPRRVAVFIRGR
jgi:hypothetical protein